MDNELHIKIEKYLNGDMPQEEAVLFEQQIANSDTLRKEVLLSEQLQGFFGNKPGSKQIPNNEFTKRLSDFIKSEESQRIRTSLSKAKNQYKKEHSVRKRNKYPLMVASILLLLIIPTISYFLLKPTDPEKLYTEFYDIKDIPSLTKRDTQPPELTNGLIAFDKKEYEKALSYFEKYIEKEKDVSPSTYIYTGVINTYLKRYDTALAEYDKLISSNTIDQSKGLWFKALTYLKMRNIKQAKSTLGIILKSEHNFKYTEAKKLLQELE